MKTYLGDGVYLDCREAYRAVLTPENGIVATNTIYLEPEVAFALWRELQNWLKPKRAAVVFEKRAAVLPWPEARNDWEPVQPDEELDFKRFEYCRTE